MAVQNGAYTRTNSFAPQSDGIMPRFFIESIQDPIASEREGRPIFRDQERVELIIPGNNLNIPVEVVNASHKERWPKAYESFKAGIEMSADGTPLEQWPILRPAQIMELKALNLFTVEHVAEMSDHTIQRIAQGGMRLRELAKAYLDDAAASASLAKATADNERKDARISELEHQLNQMRSLLDTVHSDMQTLKNAPSPIATMIPGMGDPVEQAKRNPEPVANSSLDNLPAAPRRRRQQQAAPAERGAA